MNTEDSLNENQNSAIQISEVENGDIQSSASLKNELSGKVKDLYFPSESDHPIEAVSYPSSGDPLKTIAEADSSKPAVPVQQGMKFADFYEKYAVAKDWQSAGSKEFAAKFGAALDVMKEHLDDLQIFRQGEVEVDLFILGRDKESNWTGLKTTVVETGEE
jgi:hypothetical protein